LPGSGLASRGTILLALHHVSIVTADLEKSRSFYRDIIGLAEIPRPNFAPSGAWLALGRCRFARAHITMEDDEWILLGNKIANGKLACVELTVPVSQSANIP
jgi:catechol-2,3-dioxygenase